MDYAFHSVLAYEIEGVCVNIRWYLAELRRKRLVVVSDGCFRYGSNCTVMDGVSKHSVCRRSVVLYMVRDKV